MSTKTYVLAPNFSYHPNTSICIGDIIANPNDPTKPLSSVSEAELKPTESHFDYENELNSQSSQSLKGSVWAKFIEKASTTIGGGIGDELLTKYTIRRLETIYFKKQPTDEEAVERVKDKKVKAAINAGIVFKNPVFMITGLKIARGFQLSDTVGSDVNLNADLKASITPEIAVGADGEYPSKSKIDRKHRTGQDIVFAYQLHIIAYPSFWAKSVEINVYKPKATFLNNEKKNEEVPLQVEEASASVFRKFDRELRVEVLSATDGVCIIFSEE